LVPDEKPPVLFIDSIQALADQTNSDLYVYAGELSLAGYDQVCEVLEAPEATKRENASLFLNTYGGDAHAAYRIARAIGHHYKNKKLTLYVFGDCKSAGTLLALGFDRIVMGDRGELGPMDVQMASKEELFEYNSGLDMIQAMDFLQRHAKDAFHGFLHDIRVNTRLGTKSAGEMARQLTQGLFSGMYSQLDPVRLGHVQRTMRITEAYGRRLVRRSRSLRSEKALQELVYRYPSHDFVIDRREAREELFADDVIACPDELETLVGMVLYTIYPPNLQARTLFFSVLDELNSEDSESKRDESNAPSSKKTKATGPRKTTSPSKERAKMAS